MLTPPTTIAETVARTALVPCESSRSRSSRVLGVLDAFFLDMTKLSFWMDARAPGAWCSSRQARAWQGEGHAERGRRAHRTWRALARRQAAGQARSVARS